jgi:two-component system response regulator YesN
MNGPARTAGGVKAMIRVLIADDEMLVRIGLKTIIPWEGNGFELIGEAANGREALNILKRQPCDIVLTDIRMPEMDGLELIEEIHRLSPRTKCLILSNHDEFEYVQRALRLGAADYLLKLTMEPSELLRKLGALKEAIEEDMKKRQEESRTRHKMDKYGREAKEKRLRELLLKQAGSRSEIEASMQEFGIRPFAPPIYVVNIVLDRYRDILEENKFRSEHLLHYTVINILNEIFRKYSDGELLEIGEGKFSILTDRFQDAMLKEMRDAVATFLKLSVSIGVSSPFSDILGMNAAYEQADAALGERFYAGAGSLKYYEHIQYAEPGELPKPWTEDEWRRLVELRDEDGMLRLLDRWYGSILEGRKRRPEDEREVWAQWVYMMGEFARSLGGDLYSVPLHRGMYPNHAVRSLETLHDIYDWCRGWLSVYLDYLHQLSRQQHRPEIQAVLDMIRERYSEPLKVSELAKEVGFTENYLSHLFKKETGETIMDCLTRIRMDKARELLKDRQHLKIYEISEMVGYSDPNYFSKQFKKMEGVYPLEFRKLHLGRKT